MAIIYIDPSQATNGTGSFANPYNTPDGMPTPARGDSIVIKTGTRLRGRFPQELFVNGLITLGYYGTGAKPILDGSIDVPAASWTFDAANNVWSYQLAAATGGHVTEGNQILRFVEWDTNVATTAAKMYNGTACWNYNTNVIYVKPLGGVMSGKVLRASNIRTGVFMDSGASGCTVDGLVFVDYSKESQLAQNCHGVTVQDCESYRSGGWRDASIGFFVGGAFGAGTSTRDFTVQRCTAEDVFDSPFSSQLYAGQTVAQTLMNHVYDNCIGRRFGYSGFEWTALSPKGRVLGIYMTNSLIEDGANDSCWHTYARDHVVADNEKGSGISAIGGHLGRGNMDRVYARDVTVRRCARGVRNSFTNGDILLDRVTIDSPVLSDLHVDQLSKPGYPRTRIIYNELTRINSVGDFTKADEYPDAILEGVGARWG